VIYTYTPELYPTRIRGWGAGAAAAVGRIAGIFGPYFTASIVGTPARPEGVDIAFAIFTIIFLLIAANVFLLGEETKGRTLEEISAQAMGESPMRETTATE
jgi:putative MFS transporter